MSDAVLEILQPLVEPIIEICMEPIIEVCVKKENIQGIAEILRDLGYKDAGTGQTIQKKYGFTGEETAEYV